MKAKEKVIKYMARNRPIGTWYYSYELAGKFVNGENTGTDADTRLYSIINDDDGKYSSPNFNYFIEKRRLGKYTEFRISKKEKKDVFIPGAGRLSTV